MPDDWKESVVVYGPLLLRVGLAAVFLYFGFSQLRNPELFVGWLPQEVAMLPISGRTFVILNGGFEVFFGTLMLVGMFVRTSALLLGLHLMGITFSIGMSEIGVRDFGLSIATLTLVLLGPGAFALEEYLSRKGRDASAEP